jgi:hypothetical protein
MGHSMFVMQMCVKLGNRWASRVSDSIAILLEPIPMLLCYG